MWGTGSASREFLYVDDAARGIVLAAEHYNKPDPVNLGSGTGNYDSRSRGSDTGIDRFSGEIHWDTSKPDGQPKRSLDVKRAKKEFGFEAQMPFRKGLEKTIEWYQEHSGILNEPADSEHHC